MPNREHETSLEEGLSERSKLIPLFLGPILALCLYFVLPTSYVGTEGDVVQFSDAARACTAMVLWMGIWWLCFIFISISFQEKRETESMHGLPFREPGVSWKKYLR